MSVTKNQGYSPVILNKKSKDTIKDIMDKCNNLIKLAKADMSIESIAVIFTKEEKLKYRLDFVEKGVKNHVVLNSIDDIHPTFLTHMVNRSS